MNLVPSLAIFNDWSPCRTELKNTASLPDRTAEDGELIAKFLQAVWTVTMTGGEAEGLLPQQREQAVYKPGFSSVFNRWMPSDELTRARDKFWT